MNIIQFLKWICGLLNESKIDYMLTGSFALCAYTTPRGSNDVDILLNINNNDVENFLKLFDEKEFYINPPIVREEVKRGGFFNFISLKYGYKLDFVVKRDNDFSNSEFSRKQFRKVYDYDVWVISLEDLIISKLAWIQVLESNKQMKDIEFLLLDTNPDMEYIHHWIKVLNLKTYGLIK